MIIFKDVSSLKGFIRERKAEGKQIGFVPTMGSLHNGHLSLINASKQQSDITICSIYVNPTQFNNPKDLETYPKKEAEDISLLEEAKCDVLFLPSNEVMYPKTQDTSQLLSISFGAIEQTLEGEHRPGHFSGVGIVVSKLFHIVQPDKAFFGQKDLQQSLIIRKLERDLFFDIEIVVCPTQRESDGLALSSRNVRLLENERVVAPLLYSVLDQMKTAIEDGIAVKEVVEKGKEQISENGYFKLEYLEIRNTHNLQPLDSIDKNTNYAILVAAHLGNVRLIDNLLIER